MIGMLLCVTVNAVTLWSETFNSGDGYADQATTAQSNNEGVGDNCGISGADWTLSGSGWKWEVDDNNQLEGDFSLVSRNTGGAQLNFDTEQLTITGYTDVIIGFSYRDKNAGNHMDDSDDIQAFYKLDGGAWTSFGYDNNDVDAELTFTSAALVGTTLQLRIQVQSDDNNNWWRVDNILIVGTAASEPIVTTTGDASVTCNAENLSGNVTDEGASAITTRGIIIYPATEPDDRVIGQANVLNFPEASIIEGAFTMSTTGLTGGTAYKYRAYAINGSGTGYGTQVTLTTDACVCNPCYSVANGNVDASSTWSITSGGPAGATIANDGTVDIVVEGGFTVNLNTTFSLNDVTVGATGNGILQYSAASVTLTIKDQGADDGSITIASGSSIDENGQTDANISFPDAAAYTIAVADATNGLECDNLLFSSTSVTTLSGAGKVDIKNDFRFDGTGNAFTNNLTGTFTIGNDFQFNGGVGAGSTATIWSEDFESYGNNVTSGGSNNEGVSPNAGAAGSDWSRSGTKGKTGNKNVASGARQFQVENGTDTWTSESINITGLTNVTASMTWLAHGNVYDDNGEYITLQYQVDGGAFTTFTGGAIVDTDMPNSHSETTGTVTQAGLSGTSLVLKATFFSNSGHEFQMVDDILVTGDEVTVGAGGSNTFTTNQPIAFTGADSDISFLAGSSNNFVNNSTITGLDDVDFNAPTVVGASNTIWSEDFESYGNNVTSGGSNNEGVSPNAGAAGSDWSRSGTKGKTGNKNVASGARQFQVENGTDTWTSESINITGLTNVTASMTWLAHGNVYDDNGEYITLQYQVDGGAFTTFTGGAIVDTDMPNSHSETTGTVTQAGLSGTSLVLKATFFSNSGHEFQMVDDILVTASTASSSGDNNTFTNNSIMTFSGANADIYYAQGSTNSFVNNGTITVLNDIDFEGVTTDCSFVGQTGSSATGSGRIMFRNLNGNTNNFITNDGIINMTSNLLIRQGNITIANTANGKIDIGGYMQMEDNNNGDTDISNAGDFTVVGDVYLVASNESADILNLSGGTFECANITAQNGDLDITNEGTINQTGTFLTNDASATFINSTNGRWNYSGTSHDTDTDLRCSASDNTFNYNKAGDQGMIAVQNDDYHHLEITTSGIKTSPDNMDIEGNLLISGSATFDVLSNTNNITIAGNWVNTSSNGFTQGSEDVTFDGTVAQTITCSNLGTETFHNLFINKSSGNSVSLNDHIEIENGGIINFNGTNGYIDINTNNLTKTDWSNGDITGYDTDEFIIVDQTGFIKFNGVDAGEVLNIPMGLSAAATSYALADLTMTNAGTGTLDANLCGQIAKTGETCGGTAETDSFVGYTWNFVSTSTAADVSLTWGTNAELPVFNRALCAVVHYTGTQWEHLGSYGPASTSGTLHTRSGTTTGFSPFGVQMTGSPLPIELLSFTAAAEDDQVAVKWITASEINSDYFTAEKSIDGKNFEVIATVPGAGNSFIPLSYSAIDNAPYKGNNYYRLRQTDYDGTETVSSVITINLSEENTHSDNGFVKAIVFPNPINGSSFYLRVENEGNEKQVLVIVYNQMRQEVYSKVIIIAENGSTITAIDIREKLQKGLYIITGCSDQHLFTKKIIVK